MISIVIPTYQRPRQLTRCLEAIARLQYRRDDFEVIVVDDGGDAPLDSLVASCRQTVALTLVRQARGGPAVARNAGASHARGRYLAFLDDDCAPDPGWLQALAGCFATDPDAAVGGRTVNALPDNLYSTATQLLVDRVCDYYNADPAETPFFPSSNLALPKKGFDAVGGFNPGFEFPGGEDRDFCDRWVRCGFGLLSAPEAVVYHAHFLTARSFWKQHFTYGRGAHRFWRTRPARVPMKIDARRLAFHLRLPFAPSSSSGSPRPVALAAALIVSQVATACGFASEAVRSR